MRHPTSTQLSRMQGHAVESMWDLCVILRWASVADDYGTETSHYTADAAAITCGFDASGQREVMGVTQIEMTDAVVRLPIATSIDRRDRIQITYRHDVALTTIPTFAIIGQPERGPSAIQLNLRLVTDGS